MPESKLNVKQMKLPLKPLMPPDKLRLIRRQKRPPEKLLKLRLSVRKKRRRPLPQQLKPNASLKKLRKQERPSKKLNVLRSSKRKRKPPRRLKKLVKLLKRLLRRRRKKPKDLKKLPLPPRRNKLRWKQELRPLLPPRLPD
jgi:hypothetical protein